MFNEIMINGVRVTIEQKKYELEEANKFGNSVQINQLSKELGFLFKLQVDLRVMQGFNPSEPFLA